MIVFLTLLVLLFMALLTACQTVSTESTAQAAIPSQAPFRIEVSPTPSPFFPSPTATLSPSPTATPSTVRFAVLGDYGQDGPGLAAVAALIEAWKVDLILTVGDNNYPVGAAETIDANIGKYFHRYIFPYRGTYGEGGEVNRFFPTLGNHDWMSQDARPYFEYFTLPGNERYYDFTWGPVHFFALDSDPREPDGVGSRSLQAKWLQERLAESESPWQVVYFHHAPYSSGSNGSTAWMRWPFADWGADVVFSGHDHVYERLQVDGIPYFIVGLGGGGRYHFGEALPESQFRFNAAYGALLGMADATELVLEFYTVSGERMDGYRLRKP
ncbi:MAG: metallophosphoesterase [Anaerolineales bacterium]|nr:metallophosphoesterase [Anaerolineales bacterium]MDW8226798.1 metallophosphoesterase [Anaerolineales bacterium]